MSPKQFALANVAQKSIDHYSKMPYTSEMLYATAILHER
jgi:hypothetical protein